MALLGGWAGFESNRQVGIDHANADFNGWYINPSLTVGSDIESAFLEDNLQATARISYTGLFVQGYTESDMANPLTVDGREVYQFNARAQLTLPKSMHHADGKLTETKLRFGAEGNFNIGETDLAGSIGGTAIDLSANRQDNNVFGFFGATLVHTSADGLLSFNAGFEAQTDFDGSNNLTGQIALKRRF